MLTVIGIYRGTSKNGKPFAVLHYNYDADGMEWGMKAESVVCSQEYADKLISYYRSGGELLRGWSKKDNQSFLFIPKK